MAIYALNSGNDPPGAIAEFWEAAGYDFTAVADLDGRAGANADSVGAAAFPVNIVVGPDGRVLHARVGFHEERIRELLGID